MITEHAQALFDPMLRIKSGSVHDARREALENEKKPLTFTSEARFIMKHGTDFFFFSHLPGTPRQPIGCLLI